MKFLPALVCGIAVTAATAEAAEWYVTANGSDSGAGTQASPISLTKALSSSSPARAGDTIWLRGGTYNSSYTSNLNGTAAAPIVVRAYPGERVILNANNSAARSADVVLSIFGSHTYYWGFEIMSTDPFRPTTDGAHGPNGIYVNTSTNIKLINLIIHDLPGQGVGMWTENTGAEMYGCLVYNVGSNHWDHGIYVQNQTGTKKIADNIVVNAASHGFHAYGSSEAFLNNITLDGNTIYESGILGGSPERNILLGGLVVAQNPVVTNNYTYYRGTSGGNSNIGYSAGASNAQVKNNVWVGGNAAVRMMFSGGTVTGNSFIGPLDPEDTMSRWPSNTASASRPTTGNQIFVRKNTYEPGRAHITIYNWAKTATVAVPLSQAGLNVGDGFEIRDAMNYFGAPLATGTYDGSSSISIPMNNLQPAAPLGTGLTYPIHTAPQFGAFVLVRTTAGSGGGGGGGGTTDTVAPTVSITAPAGGATISGTVTLTANAADNTAVAGVQFQVDGANAGAEDTSAPYSLAWNSASIVSGAHTVTAIARDAAGNRTTSAGVAVTVANAPAPPTNVRIVIEAEAASTLRNPMVKQNDAGASGGQFITNTSANSGYARFTVNIPKAGNYVVWGRVQAPSDSSDSFYVSADNGATDIYDVAEGKWSSAWQWTVVNGRGATGGPASISRRTFNLSAGTHTIRFDGREVNTRLDKILITDDFAYIPQ